MIVAFIYLLYNYHVLSNALPTTRIQSKTGRSDTEIASLKPEKTESDWNLYYFFFSLSHH